MRSHDRRTSGSAAFAVKMFGSAVAVLSLLAVTQAADAATVSGGSDTIFRLRGTRDRDLYPLYEYLHLSVFQPASGGSLSFNFGGWGRLDLADKTTGDRAEGDLQYGYLSYRGDRNNLLVNVGRVWVTEGIAAEHVDGAYFRSDLAAGFSGAAFAGRPVVTEPDLLGGGDVIYGGRIAHSMGNFYTLGLSAVKTSQVDNETDKREEEAIDLWLHPIARVDLTGTSSYNSRTGGWMEHTYRLSVGQVGPVRVNLDLSKINYRDYFHHVTTPALSLAGRTLNADGTVSFHGFLNPDEELLRLGGSAGYALNRNWDVVADYAHYDYELQGDAHYFGAKGSYLRDTYSAGASVHRMQGSTDRLQYTEMRVYATKRIGKAELTVDLFDVVYDNTINRESNSFSLSAAAAYQFAANLRASADIEYQSNPDYENRVQGLVKLVYAFDMKSGGEGRAK